MEQIGRTVSVTGIGSHELPGLDIVACAAHFHTNHGKVVVIMHEYAYCGRGKPFIHLVILSGSKNTCDDKSFYIGGKQVIASLDGSATPLQCWTGLMYMNLFGKPTHADLDKCPYVLLTGTH